eukprot:12608203-Alexandrium_andersonii.AAC.1
MVCSSTCPGEAWPSPLPGGAGSGAALCRVRGPIRAAGDKWRAAKSISRDDRPRPPGGLPSSM